MKTNYSFKENIGNKAIILTHGMGSSIQNRTLIHLSDVFYDLGFHVLKFDLFGHGLSEGNFEDLTLTICYKQVLEMIDFLHDKGITEIYLYGTSMSGLPILKAGIEKNIKGVFLKSPIVDYYKKRLKDIGGEQNMQIWKDNGIYCIGKNYKTGEEIYSKYNFIQDYIDNFQNIFKENNSIKTFIGSGIYDEEIDIKDLEQIVKNSCFYSFKKYKEPHKFSDIGGQFFEQDLILYYKNLQN